MPALSASRRLAYVLRHAPASIGLVLDAAGWGDVTAVCAGLGLSREELEALVRADAKGRYTLSADAGRHGSGAGAAVDR